MKHDYEDNGMAEMQSMADKHHDIEPTENKKIAKVSLNPELSTEIDLKNAKQAAKTWLTKGLIKANGGLLNGDSLQTTINKCHSELYSKSGNNNAAITPKNFLETEIKSRFEKLQSELRSDLIENVRCKKGEDLNEFNKFLSAIFPDGHNKLQSFALKSFLQHTKLKMLNRHEEIKDHFFLIFFGKQGLGKSLLCKHLLAPIKDYVVQMETKQLNDPTRIGPALSSNYVAMMDELSGMSRTDKENLKSQVTGLTNSIRKFHSQEVVTMQNNVTYLGTTNESVEKLFKDDQQRRFIQLELKTKINFNKLFEVDFLKLWQGVDENASLYLDNIKEELLVHQADLSTPDDFTTFIEDLEILSPDKNVNLVPVLKASLYQYYANWVTENGYKPYSSRVFYTNLKGKLTERRVGNKKRSCYMVSVNSPVVSNPQNIFEVENLKGLANVYN